jgi:NAD+ kinase
LEHTLTDVKKIGLVVKKDLNARRKADELTRWFEKKGVTVVRRPDTAITARFQNGHTAYAPSDLSAVFVLGGDGTFLSAVSWIGDQAIPLIGVKFGEVGFLAEIMEDDLFTAATAVIRADYALKSRMRLIATVTRDGNEVACETVLNDVVINKGALARLADIETYIDGHFLTTYRADGLIIATPTGSTAYSLAAGGPVIHPAVPSIVMTPICPFTLTNRPLIVPDSATITIRLSEGASDIMLTADGQAGYELSDADVIELKKSPQPVQLITLPGRHYFDVLKAKLRWGGGRV